MSENTQKRTWTLGDMLKNGIGGNGIDSSVKHRLDCYALALQHKILTVDEVRQMEELPKIVPFSYVEALKKEREQQS
jgi:hypothetical protein